jgi:hypothetical protein
VKRLLLTSTRPGVEPYLEEWSRVAVGCVCEALELVKEAEVERFGGKSYFLRKTNGLSPADSDEDLDLVGDDVHAQGFEELEEEEDVGALEEGPIEVDTDEV